MTKLSDLRADTKDEESWATIVGLLEKHAARHTLKQREIDYARDSNPLHAWEAFRAARANGLGVPQWVLGYLDNAAKTLLAIRDKKANGTPPKREAEQAGKAIGFKKGRGENGFFADTVQLEFDREIHFHMIELYKKEQVRLNGRKPNLEAARKALAKSRNTSEGTIRRALDRIKLEEEN
jgi:hypothetical protein